MKICYKAVQSVVLIDVKNSPVTFFTSRLPYTLHADPSGSCLYVGLKLGAEDLQNEKKPRERRDCAIA